MGEDTMSAMREKDQADFDLETFVDLFDTAMNSENPAVKKALKNLILISAIVNASNQSDGLRKGPLRRLVDDMNTMNRRIGNLEGAGQFRSQPVQPNITTSPNTVPSYPTTHWPGVINPGHIPPGTIISGNNTSGVSYTAPNSGAKAAQSQFASASLDDFLVKLDNK